MLSYTFTTREKVLLSVLCVGLIALAWYQLIFSNIQSQTRSVESQIASTEDELAAARMRQVNLARMREVVEGYQAEGVEPMLLPTYDNTQDLMAYLNQTLASTQSFSISFASPATSADDNAIHRTGTIKYETTSYEEARAVAEAISRGPYPCQVDALGIQAKKSGRSSEASTSYSSTMQVTFYEAQPSEDSVAAE